MKAILKRINGDQQGVALVLALVVLLLGGLITAGLLAHMGAGLLATETYDRRTAELYAADAGVEDAIWKIQNHVEQVKELTQCRQSWSYNITDIDGRVAEVNDKHVEVTITLISVWEDIPCDYRIVSRAISDCSETQIEAYISGASVSDDYSGILDGILTSQGGLDWKDKVTLIYPEGHEPADNYEGAWPDEPAEVDRFVRFYRMDLEDEPGFDSDTVDLAGTDMNLQQVYRDGELAIKNSIKTDPAPTLSLNGTVFITGDALIGTGEKDFILDLNGQTIFVVSDSADPDKALWVGGHCTVEGPGCIIAIGDIYFEPNPDVGDAGKPVFVFSVLGATTIRPGVSMYGAIAGSVEVDVQSGSRPQISYPIGGFGGLINFPGFVGTKLVYSISSWEIGQQ